MLRCILRANSDKLAVFACSVKESQLPVVDGVVTERFRPAFAYKLLLVFKVIFGGRSMPKSFMFNTNEINLRHLLSSTDPDGAQIST